MPHVTLHIGNLLLLTNRTRLKYVSTDIEAQVGSHGQIPQSKLNPNPPREVVGEMAHVFSVSAQVPSRGVGNMLRVITSQQHDTITNGQLLHHEF